MRALRDAVQEFRALGRSTPLDLQYDDGNVQLSFLSSEGTSVSVSALYTDPESYPGGGVVLWSDFPDPTKIQALERLAESELHRHAPLQALVERVGGCLGGCRGWVGGCLVG